MVCTDLKINLLYIYRDFVAELIKDYTLVLKMKVIL